MEQQQIQLIKKIVIGVCVAFFVIIFVVRLVQYFSQATIKVTVNSEDATIYMITGSSLEAETKKEIGSGSEASIRVAPGVYTFLAESGDASSYVSVDAQARTGYEYNLELLETSTSEIGIHTAYSIVSNDDGDVRYLNKQTDEILEKPTDYDIGFPVVFDGGYLNNLSQMFWVDYNNGLGLTRDNELVALVDGRVRTVDTSAAAFDEFFTPTPSHINRNSRGEFVLNYRDGVYYLKNIRSNLEKLPIEDGGDHVAIFNNGDVVTYQPPATSFSPDTSLEDDSVLATLYTKESGYNDSVNLSIEGVSAAYQYQDFYVLSGTTGVYLVDSDGGVELISGVTPTNPENIIVVESYLYFNAGDHLWRYSFDSGIFQSVAAINNNIFHSEAFYYDEANNRILFSESKPTEYFSQGKLYEVDLSSVD